MYTIIFKIQPKYPTTPITESLSSPKEIVPYYGEVMYSLAAGSIDRIDLEIQASPVREEVMIRKEFPETWIWEFVDDNGCDIFLESYLDFSRILSLLYVNPDFLDTLILVFIKLSSRVDGGVFKVFL